jgi:hypothetical protein
VTKFLLLLCLPALASAAPFTAFRNGETFSYKASFLFLSHIGDITIAAQEQQLDGRAVMCVTTDTKTRNLSLIYTYYNQAQVVFDRKTGQLLSVKEKGADSKRASDTELVFDYATRTAQYTDRVRTERSTVMPIPEGDPVDLISALVQTRDWNMKPGDKRNLLVQFGRELYPLVIQADHFEEVRTPLGTYQTLVLVPRMDTNPKGIFKKGGEIKVWISQDASSLPVKMQLSMPFGAISMLLNKYEGPTAAQVN